MDDITQIRTRIDQIDNQIIGLFQERMAEADKMAEAKRASGSAVLDRSREREKIAGAADQVPPELKPVTTALMQLMMSASRLEQTAKLVGRSPYATAIERALETTPQLFPADADVACQGVEGAYSQIAADRLFTRPRISYFDRFEGVFKAVEQGFCEYGVLPLENSTAGSVNSVYDLMMKHDFHIVRSTRLQVNHSLLAKPGTRLPDVHDVYSHQQALSQCGAFLSTLDKVKVHVCANTAEAARLVAESDEPGAAALSSASCAELYGLEQLARNVQDQSGNFTRFACITKDLQIFPGANRASLMLVTSHEPGALFKVLSSFYALGINIVKLESRPLPDRDFEFMFYFDIECPAVAPEFGSLLAELAGTCEELRYLGSYSEVI